MTDFWVRPFVIARSEATKQSQKRLPRLFFGTPPNVSPPDCHCEERSDSAISHHCGQSLSVIAGMGIGLGV